MTQKPSTLRTLYSKIMKLPAPIQMPVFTLAFGSAVKFFKTAKLRFINVTPSYALCEVKNRRRVQNHINGVHAVGMALIAESATGVLVGLNVPASSIPVIKSMHVDYVKRATGSMRAEARLTEEQIMMMQTEPKGEITVACKVTDDDAKEPIMVEMVWAWVPAKR